MPAVTNSPNDYQYRNYKGTSKTDKVYNVVFEDKADDSIGFKDLFDLMIRQLSNQDFLNPVDDTQYLAQMTQIASMSAMQDLAKYSQSQYMVGFLGKEVTASKYEIGGSVLSETGIVTAVSWDSKGEYKYTVNGKTYGIKDITLAKIPDAEKRAVMEYLGREVVTVVKDSSGKDVKNTGIVTSIEWDSKENDYLYTVNGKKYSLKDIVSVSVVTSEPPTVPPVEPPTDPPPTDGDGDGDGDASNGGGVEVPPPAEDEDGI